MNEHGGHEMSVVGVFANDMVNGHETFPFRQDRWPFIECQKERFERGQFDQCLCRGLSKAIGTYGSRANHPELVEVLWNQSQRIAADPERRNCIACRLEHRVSRL